MNTRAYIQTIKATLTCLCKNETTDEMLYIFEDLRKAHSKMANELDAFLVYPRYDLKLARECCIMIQEICKTNKIKVVFTEKNSDSFKKSYYAYYYIKNNVEITDLIVYRKQDKNKDTKPLNEITENDL